MTKDMMIACRISIVSLALCGLAYPLFTCTLAHVLFPDASAGSFVAAEDGFVVGSRLIGQSFTRPGYFHPRPSAAGPQGYDAMASGGPNYGPTSKALRARIAHDAVLLAADPHTAIPADLLTASASGLDPDISPTAAMWQAPRVARARGVSPERVEALVTELAKAPQLGFLGEPRINVLQLNLALDRRFGQFR